MAAPEVLLPNLTPAQARVLIAIEQLYQLQGYAPTVRELRDRIGYGSVSTIHAHLSSLREAGYVNWVPTMARTLALTDAGRAIVTR